MGDNQNTVNNLIGGIEFKDSRLASLLQTLANDLYGLNRQVNPPENQSVSGRLPGGGAVTIIPATDFTITVFLNDIRLNWTASPIGIFLYEIRLGPIFETANILLTTATHSAEIDPVSRFIITNQTYTFWLVTEDEFGNRSVPLSAIVTIPAIGTPLLSASVVGNSVLLRWTQPASAFQIDHYNVFRNGTPIGILNGTFDVIFEPTAGTFSYSVQAVDIVGNLGPRSADSTFVFSNPVDFFLFQNILDTGFTGTRVNCAVDLDGKLLMNVSISAWQNHFIDNGFTSIQDQITLGYVRYYQPIP